MRSNRAKRSGRGPLLLVVAGCLAHHDLRMMLWSLAVLALVLLALVVLPAVWSSRHQRRRAAEATIRLIASLFHRASRRSTSCGVREERPSLPHAHVPGSGRRAR